MSSMGWIELVNGVVVLVWKMVECLQCLATLFTRPCDRLCSCTCYKTHSTFRAGKKSRHRLRT